MDPYLGEIRIMAFNFVPRGWARCDGQILSIQQNQALFSLLGTNYGGDGIRTFALPDLRGRIPLHANGASYWLGQAGGEDAHTLTNAEMPAHSHALQGSGAPAVTGAPANAVLGTKGRLGRDLMGPANSTLAPAALSVAGGNQPHENMQPYLPLTFAIALTGIFPPRN
ncbi:phage tail protein [Duganella sp. BJB1802]|uniref:phage tail protein n=1 Tax=Duganella sp. BJB1802 TaxID=2744575 RepID=UPI001594CDDE|nr:tail fiber protein [Duganella sp. BJB1802]NVD70704.1 phage tail protein [Duganella sp. BJB1802]